MPSTTEPRASIMRMPSVQSLVCIALLLLSALGLSGCGKSKAEKQLEAQKQAEAAAATQKAKDDAAKTEELQKLAVNLLKDPGSAQFRNTRLVAGAALCGEVNAKNAMGGYVGFRPFVVAEGKAVIAEAGPECNESNSRPGTDCFEKVIFYKVAASKAGCIPG